MNKGVRYPEHEKIARLDGTNNRIGEFLEWLRDVHHVQLPKSISDLLADYYEIDLDKLDEEKQHLLKVQRRLPVFDDIEKDIVTVRGVGEADAPDRSRFGGEQDEQHS